MTDKKNKKASDYLIKDEVQAVKSFSLRISAELKTEAQKTADSHNVSLNYFIEAALRAYLDRLGNGK